jgi:hypothetical protein
MTLDWPAIGKAALFIGLPLAGFLLGGGWPWKAYRRLGDLDLEERLKHKFWLRSEQDAYAREREMVSAQQDEVIAMLKEQTKAILSLTGSVERHTIAIEFFGPQIRDLQADVEEIKDRKRGA